jgi:hypothetical protein
MRRHHHTLRLAAMLPLFLAMPAEAARPIGAADKLIYKVDSVVATVMDGRVLIQAKGAVTSGGWKEVRLKIAHYPVDPHTITVDFVALAPAANAPVIHGLLPVDANIVVPMHSGVVTVRVVSDANEMTTQILKTAQPPRLRAD